MLKERWNGGPRRIGGREAGDRRAAVAMVAAGTLGCDGIGMPDSAEWR